MCFGVADLCRYIPKYIGVKESAYSPEEVAELNRVNSEIVKLLHQKHSFVRDVSTTDAQVFVEVGWVRILQ